MGVIGYSRNRKLILGYARKSWDLSWVRREINYEKDEKVVRPMNWRTRWSQRLVGDGTPDSQSLYCGTLYTGIRNGLRFLVMAR